MINRLNLVIVVIIFYIFNIVNAIGDETVSPEEGNTPVDVLAKQDDFKFEIKNYEGCPIDILSINYVKEKGITRDIFYFIIQYKNKLDNYLNGPTFFISFYDINGKLIQKAQIEDVHRAYFQKNKVKPHEIITIKDTAKNAWFDTGAFKSVDYKIYEKTKNIIIAPSTVDIYNAEIQEDYYDSERHPKEYSSKWASPEFTEAFFKKQFEGFSGEK